MSQVTPTSTPVRSANQKKLPLIVDVAIDNNTGQQLYQVHESSKLVRKEMPKSNHFSRTVITEETVFFDSNNSNNSNTEKTPTRNVLGTLSPSSLKERKYVDVDNYPEPIPTTKRFNGVEFHQDMLAGVPAGLSGNTDVSSSDSDIWSEDVEQAFEEVLKLIPKNGLTKIKIAGRSCGRNELISDYIFTKTGKFRTRKQISSHIQVIKNLGENKNVINLINEGPVYANEEERIEATKKFEEIFSKINLNKSLGFSDSLKRNGNLPQLQAPKKRKSQKLIPKYKFENFFMAVTDQYNLNPIVFSIQHNVIEVKRLKVKSNANISQRFPGMDEFRTCANTPIIHNMVKVVFPPLPKTHSIESGFNSSFTLKREIPNEGFDSTSYPQTFSSFTSIYLFGKESLKFNTDGLTFNDPHDFLVKFWKVFLRNLMDKKDAAINDTLKGLTIKQIMYERSPNSVKQVQDVSMVAKSKIVSVLLWEFARVSDFSEAVTTTTNLVLPPLTIETAGGNISSQTFEYSNPNNGAPMAGPSNLDLSHSNWTATSAALDSTFTNAPMQSSLQTSAATILSADQWDQSQSRVQKKFQQLQHDSHQPASSPGYPGFSPYSKPAPLPVAPPSVMGPPSGSMNHQGSMPLANVQHSTNMDLPIPTGGVVLNESTINNNNNNRSNGFNMSTNGYQGNGF